MESLKLSGWAGGSHNLSEVPPEGFLLEAVNFDATVAGELHLRAGFALVYTGTDVRGLLALGDKLLIADAGNLVEFDRRTNSSRVLRTITGGLAGDVLNGRLYFCTANEALEYDGTEIRPWGVPDVLLQPSAVSTGSGSLLDGYYQVAMTYTDAWGREGGTDRPLLLRAAGGLSISLPAPPAGYTANLYVSPADGKTLYWQASATAATTIDLTGLRDDTATLGTALLRAPRVGSAVLAHNGVLFVAAGNVLEMTLPLRPHLVDRVSGFIQYPSEIGVLMGNRQQVFVSADRSYALFDPETSEIRQRTIDEYPAVPGTAARLPDGRCAWMTRYGQAISNEAGDVDFPSRAHYAPRLGRSGAAGVIEHNGNQMIVTALHGPAEGNVLASTTYLEDPNV